MSTEVFSNPLPPEVDKSEGTSETPLTNADFRKMLASTKGDGGGASGDSSTGRGFAVPRDYNASNDSAAEQRRKKKSFYAKLKKQEMERQAELDRKYRDRSKERREGKGDYNDVEMISTTADYRAVGPTAELDRTSAEKRRQVIQESKFLGGDMAHTHLVKGLDYALLQKVRAEITSKEKDEEILETLTEKNKDADEKEVEIIKKKETVYDTIRNKNAKKIYKVLFHNQPPVRNEIFLPGRLAYVFDLEGEYTETDIPTTLIRSKADCPNIEISTAPTTNDIVINKLTQILSYLRQGAKEKHRKRKEKKTKVEDAGGKVERNPDASLSIFDDIGDYTPSSKKSKRSKIGVGPYFEKQVKSEELSEKSLKAAADASVKQIIKNVSEKKDREHNKAMNSSSVKSKAGNPLIGLGGNQPDSYAECYPSTQFNSGGNGGDSDEEADYSKMDQGNKKGPVGRWDFDTTEEYNSYMSNKEATPKAAFQYGIKMSGGRKTRRTREQNEKQKLNRELQQIQQIIDKRKGGDTFKKPKY